MTTQTAVSPGRHLGRETRRLRELSILDPRIVRRAVVAALLKLDPRVMVHKPVMFVVYVGSIWTTLLFVRDAPRSTYADNLFTGLVVLFLWFTVLFGNFADAMAEGRGKSTRASVECVDSPEFLCGEFEVEDVDVFGHPFRAG
jgi:K+-transporting ATPase ATPase B chain